MMHKVLGSDSFDMCVNELEPGEIMGDWYTEYVNSGSNTIYVGVYLANTEKTSALFGGSLSQIAAYSVGNQHSTDGTPFPWSKDNLSTIFGTVRDYTDLKGKAWLNPCNGCALVCFEHWYTIHKNGDITFDTEKQSGTDITRSTHYNDGYHFYDTRGFRYGTLSTPTILFTRQQDIVTTLDFPYRYMNSFTFNDPTPFRDFEQSGGIYYTQYYHEDGSKWATGETHFSFYMRKNGTLPKTMALSFSRNSLWPSFLMAQDYVRPTVYWNGTENKEIYYRRHYHSGGWMWEKNKWQHVWERCPFVDLPE